MARCQCQWCWKGFEGGGVVSCFYVYIVSPTSEWPFLSLLVNCLSGTSRWRKASFGIWLDHTHEHCGIGVLGEVGRIRLFASHTIPPLVNILAWIKSKFVVLLYDVLFWIKDFGFNARSNRVLKIHASQRWCLVRKERPVFLSMEPTEALYLAPLSKN